MKLIFRIHNLYHTTGNMFYGVLIEVLDHERNYLGSLVVSSAQVEELQRHCEIEFVYKNKEIDDASES